MVSQKLIDELFTGGHSHSLAAFPLRVIFMSKEHQEGQQPVRVLISVPKKHFKHAVDRNRVKRQVREAYRKQKQLLINGLGSEKKLAVAFIWMSDQKITSEEVDGRIKNILTRIAKKVEVSV